jgi:hypothetical protein
VFEGGIWSALQSDINYPEPPLQYGVLGPLLLPFAPKCDTYYGAAESSDCLHLQHILQVDYATPGDIKAIQRAIGVRTFLQGQLWLVVKLSVHVLH